MAKIGKCKLCGQIRSFARAHIIPNSFYKPAFAEGGYAFLLRSEGYLSRITTGIYDPDLVCEECEGRFSPWDGYAKSLLLDFDWSAKIWDDVTSPGVDLPGYDYARLKLFFLSVAWRMAATHRPEFVNAKIPAPRLEELADRLLRQDPGDADDWSVLLSRFRGPAFEHVELDPRECRFLAPYRMDSGGAAYLKMHLADWCVCVKISDTPFDGAVGRCCLAPGRPLHIILRDFGKSTELELMRDLARRS